MTENEVMSIAYDTGCMPEQCTDASLIQFARALLALQIVEPVSDEKRVPLTGGEINTVYATATNQTLRPQDEKLAFAFARGIESAHGIVESDIMDDLC